jgi:single-strand DNA-binding protein
MSIGDITITVTGNLTADPELRFTTAGVPVAGFTVAASRRVFDRETQQWQDADTLFLRCSAWRQLAEHTTDSLTKGTRVIVTGRLKQREYETAEGEKRTVYEVDVDEVGPSLRYATAKITKVTRDRVPHPAEATNAAGPAADDPWAVPAQPAAAGNGAWSGGGDKPPF